MRVTTDAGVADTDIAGTAPIALNVVPGPTRSLRMTVTAVNGSGPFHPVAVTALSIPGLHVTRTMVMPTDLSTGSRVDQVEMAVTDDARPGCVLVSNRPLCAVGTAQLGEESSGLDRTFTLPASDTYELSVTAVPRAGAALDALLRAQIRPSIVATASSQAVTDPLAGPQTTVDGDLGTGWISSVTDPAPTLHLRWSGRRTIDGLTTITDPFLAASPPDQVVVTSAAGTRTAPIKANGKVRFAALRTNDITLTLSRAGGLLPNVDPTGTGPRNLGIGVSEIALNGVKLAAGNTRAATDAKAVVLPCGAGPDVRVDDTTLPTAVSTTIAALRDRRSIPLEVCGNSTLPLGRGTHRLRIAATAGWTPVGAALRAPSAATAVPAPSVPVDARTWSDSDRSVHIGSNNVADAAGRPREHQPRLAGHGAGQHPAAGRRGRLAAGVRRPGRRRDDGDVALPAEHVLPRRAVHRAVGRPGPDRLGVRAATTPGTAGAGAALARQHCVGRRAHRCRAVSGVADRRLDGCTRMAGDHRRVRRG